MSFKAIPQLNKSSTYRRRKSFKYPIFRDQDKTISPAIPIVKRISLQEESTNHTPNTKHESPYKEPCNTDPLNPQYLIKLKPSSSVKSLQSDIYKKLSSINDLSPCKTEIPLMSTTKIIVNPVSISFQSPGSNLISSQKGCSFSRVVEKYEHNCSNPFIETNENPQLSARSGFNFRENSIEISAIAEENSLSEQNMPPEISLTLKNDRESLLSENSQCPNIIKNVSTDSILINHVSSISLPLTNRNQDDTSEKSIMRNSLPLKFSDNTENVLSLNFEEAYSIFKSLKLEYISDGLWIKSWKDKFCCIKKQELDEDALELCEKLIIFAYSGFISGDLFHERLLVSIYEKISNYTDNKDIWTDLGFSKCNPYESDLKHDVAALGLLQLLFFERYLSETFREVFKYSLDNGMAFILIAFDISEISITVLRKKLLNNIISQTSKVVETIFFLYAGCLLYWFTLHKSQEKMPGEINWLVEKLALKHPNALVNLARERWTGV
ncbi:hypothetical protein SteCoe_1560 [Stentor coeruleus]|uniref:ELMO domain-containing protein n=1 Tax=Stentor coeruleus TaxID=5963 RepID=A0A1R2D1Q8_9CILI|nr:hypothetical protein SteCoe_1560 [Stentor coeruleus]